MYALLDECDKDDFILFATNGTGIIDENTNKCTDDQQVESFSWTLLDNETKIALTDSNPDTVNVVKLTSTLLKMSITKPNSSGDLVVTVQTYKNIK